MPERQDGAGLSRGLGWLSIGLGVTELAAPRALARAIGVDERGRMGTAIRALGARELTHGISILAKPHPVTLWTRVASDAIDLAFLGWAFARRRVDTRRLIGAIASVLGVTALDVIASQRLTRRLAAEPIVRTSIVHRPAPEVYELWRNVENLPLFVNFLESAVDLGDGRARFVARLPIGGTIEWDTELVEDRVGERIALRTARGTKFAVRFRATFTPVYDGTATEVRAELQSAVPRSPLGAAIAKLFGATQLEGDLRRAKQVAETGEVVRSDASIHRGPHAARPSSWEGARR
jgi:uncharacterized membrane protein